MEKKDMRKILIASLVGSSIEWFDYFLYGTVAALVFNQLFFVTEDPAFGTLYAFATFALAFFIRPLGGVIFSQIGRASCRGSSALTVCGVAWTRKLKMFR